MDLWKKIRLLFAFHRYFLPTSLIIDGACMYLLYRNGMGAYSVLFWFKVGTLAASAYFINEYKRHEYYYFFNFGLSKKTLWISTLSFDMFLFFILIFITVQFL